MQFKKLPQYRFERLGGIRKYVTFDAEDICGAKDEGDRILTQWRKQGYRGGAQLIDIHEENMRRPCCVERWGKAHA